MEASFAQAGAPCMSSGESELLGITHVSTFAAQNTTHARQRTAPVISNICMHPLRLQSCATH
eukprot:14254014-Alexandrium_andersonii.AAC.1